MKIVLSGIYYPMAILRYFEAALKRRNDIELFTVGPSTGTWIPWNGGMNLLPKYAKPPDLALPRMQEFVPIGYIENQLPWQPDLWLQIDAGFHFHGKPIHGKNVIVGTDPHVLNYDTQRQFADTFYCMQTPYMINGDEYLPYAYDPIWHAPMEKSPAEFDACLIGLHYENRNTLVSRLEEEGLDVYYDLGPCFDEARALYARSAFGLNWSSEQDLTARVFELLAMGMIAVVNRVPDLGQFFEDGKHLLTFETADEAVEKIKHYNTVYTLEDAFVIAEAGREAVKPHTWDARVEKIINDL